MSYKNICPVCGYDYGSTSEKIWPWTDGNPDFTICPSCGIEYGYQDIAAKGDFLHPRYEELREEWLKRADSEEDQLKNLKDLGKEV